MIVFKPTLQIVKKYKFTILLYTMLLVMFTGINFQTNETNSNFVAEKPDVLIVNKDVNEGVTKNLINYISKRCNIKKIELEEEKINDALFYRDISYIIYIPDNYRNDFIDGLNPEIKVKSTNDYEASLAEMILTKYIRTASIYQKNITDEKELINSINETLKEETITHITSKLDTNNLYKATFFFNFLNYSILAGCVYVLCLILSSFREKNVNKRTIISSIKYKKFNSKLLFSCGLVAIIMWCFYIILSFILIGSIMFSINGLFYILNSLVFTICALTIAFLIGNLLESKNAINGIINIVALGSSFLCGAFVPVEYLPDSVLKVAHILPSYWFVKTNEIIKTLEVGRFEDIKPIFINMGVLLLFSILFMIATNIVTKKKRTNC